MLYTKTVSVSTLLVVTHVMKETRGNEKLLKAYIHELEKQEK